MGQIMERLIQIVYVSKSSFTPTVKSVGIEPNVARILAKSRVNNRKNGLVGVLYFGDGCFFQCLEGEETAIETLYAKLQLDPRHKDLLLISRKLISAFSFSEWAMKFVPLETKLNAELLANGYKSFDPYKFDDAMTTKVLKLLQDSSNETSEDSLDPTQNITSIEKPKSYMSIFALTFSILSLAISIFNLSHGKI